MDVLLDTCAFLFFTGGSRKLSARARETIEDPTNTIYLSVVSAWEIAIKYPTGKLELPKPPEDFIPEQISANGFGTVEMTMDHALMVTQLERHHADPFDRLIIAQGLMEALPIVSSDSNFDLYPMIVRIW